MSKEFITAKDVVAAYAAHGNDMIVIDIEHPTAFSTQKYTVPYFNVNIRLADGRLTAACLKFFKVELLGVIPKEKRQFEGNLTMGIPQNAMGLDLKTRKQDDPVGQACYLISSAWEAQAKKFQKEIKDAKYRYDVITQAFVSTRTVDGKIVERPNGEYVVYAKLPCSNTRTDIGFSGKFINAENPSENPAKVRRRTEDGDIVVEPATYDNIHELLGGRPVCAGVLFLNQATVLQKKISLSRKFLMDLVFKVNKGSANVFNDEDSALLLDASDPPEDNAVSDEIQALLEDSGLEDPE